MSTPAIVLSALGAVAYLVVGFFVAMVFTYSDDGPPRWWIRIPVRLILLVGWLPLLVLLPVFWLIGAFVS